jgi:hypothetical protein
LELPGALGRVRRSQIEQNDMRPGSRQDGPMLIPEHPGPARHDRNATGQVEEVAYSAVLCGHN